MTDSALRWRAPGLPGEVYVAGVGLARGYLGRPGLTAERFVPDPFGPPGSRMYRTGDRCRWRADGNLEFMGRLDFQVKIRGFRIELGEIEAALGAHEAVAQSVVVAHDEAGEMRLVAYLVGDATPVAALRGHLSMTLPDYMVPSAFVWLDAIPLTPNGKVDRKALPAPELDRDALSVGFVAPRTPTEAALAAIWSDVLGVESVGVEDDFFELGGHSILSVWVAGLAERAGLEVSPRMIFEAPTIAGLAARLHGDAAAPTAVVRLSSGTERPLILLPPLGGSIVPFPPLARALRSTLPAVALEDPGLDPSRGAAPESFVDLVACYLADLTMEQLAGPWRLAGYSLGSILAVEMAAQLEARGEVVERVLLLDGGCPIGSADYTHDPFGYIRFVLGQLVEQAPEVAALRMMGRAAATRALAEAFGGADDGPGAPLAYTEAMVALAERHHRQSSAWRAPTVKAPVTLLRTAGDGSMDFDYGWGEALGRPVDVAFVPGDHGSMMRPPMVQTLAAMIERILGPERGLD